MYWKALIEKSLGWKFGLCLSNMCWLITWEELTLKWINRFYPARCVLRRYKLSIEYERSDENICSGNVPTQRQKTTRMIAIKIVIESSFVYNRFSSLYHFSFDLFHLLFAPSYTESVPGLMLHFLVLVFFKLFFIHPRWICNGLISTTKKKLLLNIKYPASSTVSVDL